MIDTVTTLAVWAVVVAVSLFVVGAVVFFVYDTVATFLESRKQQQRRR